MSNPYRLCSASVPCVRENRAPEIYSFASDVSTVVESALSNHHPVVFVQALISERRTFNITILRACQKGGLQITAVQNLLQFPLCAQISFPISAYVFSKHLCCDVRVADCIDFARIVLHLFPPILRSNRHSAKPTLRGPSNNLRRAHSSFRAGTLDESNWIQMGVPTSRKCCVIFIEP